MAMIKETKSILIFRAMKPKEVLKTIVICQGYKGDDSIPVREDKGNLLIKMFLCAAEQKHAT